MPDVDQVTPPVAVPRRPVGAIEPAAVDPVAIVHADTGLAHLDRTFDYLIPATLDQVAQPGVRVRVRFARRLVDGYLVARRPSSEHVGKLSYLERVVGEDPVLGPPTLALAQAVARRYGGTVADVLRLAVPPRHAAAERSAKPPVVGELPTLTQPTGWEQYPAGPAFLHAVAARKAARAVWQALPGEDWPQRLAEVARVAVDAGRGALLLVPDARDVQRLDAALVTALGPGRHVSLTADLGPAERYRRYLAVQRGWVPVVMGTRAAAFAPVRRLGLVAIFDDGDDLYAEPRAPYPHAREVLMLRSAAERVPLLVGGFARTVEAQQLVESGWAHPISPDRTAVRAAAPRIEAAGDDFSTGSDSAAAHARLSPAAFRAAREALAAGTPVLVQVPRRGYQPGLACDRCRRVARCRRCAGPLQREPDSPDPRCRWCRLTEMSWQCPACSGRQLRATVIGAQRTSQELGRAFQGIPVITSAGDHVLPHVDSGAALVIATPGAEPIAAGGYGAALLLDGSALLSRPDLRAAEEAVRRWLGAATLVRSAADGGRVVVGADAGIPAVQALIRWDPAGLAAQELAARRELGFAPTVAMAAVEGSPEAVATALADAVVAGVDVLGPVPVEPAGPDSEPVERALLRVDLSRRRLLSDAVHTLRAAASARKDPDPARVRMDPTALF